MAYLIGDIGATNARFALTTPERQIKDMHVYRSSEFASLFEAVQCYLSSLGTSARPSKAALAVAAPLSGDEVIFPNISWRFSRRKLQADLGFEVDLYNDFSAVALAVPHLHAEDKLEIGHSIPPSDGTIG
jgi:glucokinase